MFDSIIDIANSISLYQIDTFKDLERLILKLEEDEDIVSIFDKRFIYLDSSNNTDSLFPYFHCINSTNGQKFTYQAWWTSLINKYIEKYHFLDAHTRYQKNKDFTSIAEPMLPNVLFKSKIIFERIRSQDGLFLYQINDSFSGMSSREPVIQHIKKDKTFIIKNKKHMLRQLDSIGINRKNLFLDHDSIAKYISTKQINL